MSNLFDFVKRTTPVRIKQIFPAVVKEKAKLPIVGLVRSYQSLTAASRALPHFVISGAQKSGTTTLYDQLCLHPNIFPALQKEINYFNWNYRNSLNWYKAHFPKQHAHSESFVTGEASPYYMFYPHAFRRMSKDLPNVRIIMMLRNPVDRAYSSYQHQYRKGRENFTFENAIEYERERLEPEIDKILSNEDYFSYNHAHFSYLSRGIYIDQIQNCLKYFSREQVLIIQSEKFFSMNDAIYQDVLDFLGMKHIKLKVYKNTNKKFYSTIQPKTRERLLDYFRPYNERLYDLIQQRFDWDDK